MKAYDRFMMVGCVRFAERCNNDIATWTDCPMCSKAFTARSEHTAWCRPCNAYYAEGPWMPDISRDARDFGRFLGERRGGFYPGEMVESLGWASSAEGMYPAFPVALVWRLVEDYNAPEHRSLAVFSAFMRKAASALGPNNTPMASDARKSIMQQLADARAELDSLDLHESPE